MAVAVAVVVVPPGSAPRAGFSPPTVIDPLTGIDVTAPNRLGPGRAGNPDSALHSRIEWPSS